MGALHDPSGCADLAVYCATDSGCGVVVTFYEVRAVDVLLSPPPTGDPRLAVLTGGGTPLPGGPRYVGRTPLSTWRVAHYATFQAERAVFAPCTQGERHLCRTASITEGGMKWPT